MVGLRVVQALPEMLARPSAQLRTHRDALYRYLRDRLPTWHVPRVDGGLSMWVGLDSPASSALALLCQTRGLAISAGPRFTVDGFHERFLRLPFTAPPPDLERGIEILAACWNQLQASHHRLPADHHLPSVL